MSTILDSVVRMADQYGASHPRGTPDASKSIAMAAWNDYGEFPPFFKELSLKHRKLFVKNLAPRATPAPQKLRFGIFCNGLTLSAWEAQSIQEILRLPEQPELSLVVIDDATGDPVDYASRTFLQKVRSVGLPNVLYYLTRTQASRAF